MTTSVTNTFELPFLQPGQALKTITHNEALNRLDAGLYMSCSDMAAETLPTEPQPSQTVILSPTATGESASHAGDIAIFNAGVWLWFKPKPGWLVWDETDQCLRIFTGEAWAGPQGQSEILSSTQMGINTSSNPQQRLAVASETSLFSHDGQGHRLTINRASNSETASLIFQTDYSGEAEIGLNGTEGFSVKTSADGLPWTQRLSTPATEPGIRAPTYSSARLVIAKHSAVFIETPLLGGLAAVMTYTNSGSAQADRSGFLAYDTGPTPSLEPLGITAFLEVHGGLVLDGTVSAAGTIGISAVEGGLYVENRMNSQRQVSLAFLC